MHLISKIPSNLVYSPHTKTHWTFEVLLYVWSVSFNLKAMNSESRLFHFWSRNEFWGKFVVLLAEHNLTFASYKKFKYMNSKLCFIFIYHPFQIHAHVHVWQTYFLQLWQKSLTWGTNALQFKFFSSLKPHRPPLWFLVTLS